jgi:hypothetical protein
VKLLRRLIGLAIFIAAFVLAYRLAGANAERISVDLLFTTTPVAELWIVLLCAFAFGAVAAGTALFFEIARLGLLSRRYRKTVAGLEREVHQLRNLPIGDAPQPVLPGSSGPESAGRKG